MARKKVLVAEITLLHGAFFVSENEVDLTGVSMTAVGIAVAAMRRRGLLAGVAAIATGCPVSVRAQLGRAPLIGFLFYGSPGASPELEAFRKGLREHGYIEGHNVSVEYRFARGQVSELTQLASELVSLKVDVIVTPATPASLAAQRATESIPIVFAGVADAVGAGLVPNLTRPGGNITGLTSISVELGGKRLQLLKEVVPHTTKIGVLYNPDDRANVLVLAELQAATKSIMATLYPYEVRRADEFHAAFSAMAQDKVDALFGAAGILTFEHSRLLADLAARHGIPTLWGHRQFVDAGGLMSYAVNFHDQIRRAVGYVDRILKGAKPGDLPVQQPTKFELIINLQALRGLGVSVPATLMFAADEVIE